jgi:hypothetical protein
MTRQNVRVRTIPLGWCEVCAKRRLVVYAYVENGIEGDTFCRRCRSCRRRCSSHYNPGLPCCRDEAS